MKTDYLKLLSSIAVYLFTMHLQAQTKLSGTIADRSKNPVPVVAIDFGNGLIQTTSGTDGNFSLVYPDTLKSRVIRFQAFGYKTKTMIINKGQSAMKVILVDSLYNLNTVTVSAPKYGRFSDYSAQTIQMSSFDIVTNPSAMADIIGNMRVLPGVQANDNDGRLIIQGGSPDKSQVYINNLIVMNPYSLTSKNSGVRSRFSPDLFEGITLQSGGFNAEFGQALSGIINLNTKEKALLEPKTDVSVSSVFAGVTHMDQKPSYAYRASVDYVNLEPYGKLFPDNYDWNKYFQQVSSDFFVIKEFSRRTKITAQMNFNTAGGEYSYYNMDSIVPFSNDLKETYFYAQANVYH